MCAMKNITLSISDELLAKSREYAKKNGTSVNQMVRSLLQKTVEPQQSFLDIEDSIDQLGIDTKGTRLNREDLYER